MINIEEYNKAKNCEEKLQNLNSFLGKDERELNLWCSIAIEVHGDDSLSCGRGDVVRRIKIDVDDSSMTSIGDAIMNILVQERKHAAESLHQIFNL